MEKIKQNTLEEATTDIGFAKATGTPLTRQVQLDDGTTVTVEGVTPNKMASILKSTFVTPGEKAQIPSGEYIDGVVQKYNATVTSTEDKEEQPQEPEVENPSGEEESETKQDSDTEQKSEDSDVETQNITDETNSVEDSDETNPVESDVETQNITDETKPEEELNREEETINE